MTPSPRIPEVRPTGVSGALVRWTSRRMFGRVLDPVTVGWHHRPVLRFSFALGRRAARWDRCDADLKAFAHMAVAAQVGCGFCLDLGYFTAHHKGLDVGRAREVPRWRESDVFSALERDVLEYAEAMTHTPPTVTDELSGRLLAALGAPALLELTAYVGLANLYTRTNTALGIESQGLAASCALPPLAQQGGRR